MSSDIQETADGLNKIDEKPKTKTLRARAEAYYQSLLEILETLTAVLLVSLLFFCQSVLLLKEVVRCLLKASNYRSQRISDTVTQCNAQ